MPGGPAAKVVQRDYLHVRVADSERAKPDVVLHPLTGSEWDPGALHS